MSNNINHEDDDPFAGVDRQQDEGSQAAPENHTARPHPNQSQTEPSRGRTDQRPGFNFPFEPPNTPPAGAHFNGRNTSPLVGTDVGAECVMIGPAQSGKTCLLLAIGQACHLPGPDNFELTFVPKPSPREPSVSFLMEQAVDILTGKHRLSGTREINEYSFEIHAKASSASVMGARSTRRATLEMTVHDGPGGALFLGETNEIPAETIKDWRANLAPKLKRAQSIIFCVDAMHPEQLTLLAKRMPKLIEEMAEKQFVPEEYPEDRTWKDYLRRHMPIRHIERRCINANRFLLLLNKIDHFCTGYDRPANEIAERIDPVRQATTILSIPLLQMIRSALKPNAQFAIGVTSALGFLPGKGDPLADESGHAKPGPNEEGDEILRKWTPFGIRDALFFLATGRAAGTVKLVSPQDLRPR